MNFRLRLLVRKSNLKVHIRVVQQPPRRASGLLRPLPEMRNVRRRRAQQGGRRIRGRGARRQAAGREGKQRGAAPNPLVHDGSLRDSLQRHAVQRGALRALHLFGVETEQLGSEGHREGSLAIRFEGNASVIQIHRGRLAQRTARKQQCRYRKVEERLLPAVENEEQISREGLQNLEDSEA